MVSHDVEFCARYAHRCALFFDGSIVTDGTPRDFFSGNSFYTTSANRMARSLLPGAVTPEDIIAACGGDLPPGPELPEEDLFLLFGMILPFFHGENLLFHEIGDALDRAGAGEHIHGGDGAHLIACGGEEGGVSCQRRGIAGDVDQLFGRQGAEAVGQLP